jgi:hypothetical protein
MTVCLITGEFSPMQGGVGDFTNELGKALAELETETVRTRISTAQLSGTQR